MVTFVQEYWLACVAVAAGVAWLSTLGGGGVLLLAGVCKPDLAHAGLQRLRKVFVRG